MNAVHVLVPANIDDPSRPSGGNNYDRHICTGLAARGWLVHEHPMPGVWPAPDPDERRAVAAVLAGLARGAVVLIDGIIASVVPEVLAFTDRLTVVIIVHMLVADEGDRAYLAVERAVLSSAAGIVTTSAWTKGRLVTQYALTPGRVHVIEPGVDAAPTSHGTASGGELLCVAAVTAAKGHDLLVQALTMIRDLSWRCMCVGALDLEPVFVARLTHESRGGGLDRRIRYVGTRIGPALESSYAAADVLVLCSRAETYGMVVAESLSRGIPVIVTDVGGIAEALGYDAGPEAPGILVPLEDPVAFAAALRCWLGDRQLRQRLRQAAQIRRGTLPGWPVAVGHFSDLLTRLSV